MRSTMVLARLLPTSPRNNLRSILASLKLRVDLRLAAPAQRWKRAPAMVRARCY